MISKQEIFLKTNSDDTKTLLVSDKVNSELGHFTGIAQTHIFSHNDNKVVCGSKSHFWGGLNHDLNIDLLKEVGIEQQISCIRCQKWFKKHYK